MKVEQGKEERWEIMIILKTALSGFIVSMTAGFLLCIRDQS